MRFLRDALARLLGRGRATAAVPRAGEGQPNDARLEVVEEVSSAGAAELAALLRQRFPGPAA